MKNSFNELTNAEGRIIFDVVFNGVDQQFAKDTIDHITPVGRVYSQYQFKVIMHNSVITYYVNSYESDTEQVKDLTLLRKTLVKAWTNTIYFNNHEVQEKS